MRINFFLDEENERPRLIPGAIPNKNMPKKSFPSSRLLFLTF